MVGLKLFNPNHLGIVTVIATLFVAAVVNGEQEVRFDTDHESDVFLQCQESNNKPWTIDTDEKDSPSKKIFKLAPESEGCFKSKKPVTLNSTMKFIVKFHSDSLQDDSGSIVVSLVPVEGDCGENECVWEVTKDPQYRKGEWVTAEHTFPLKSMKDYYVQLKADKPKGKFLLESLTIPNGISNSLDHLGGINVRDRLVFMNATVAPTPSGCGGLGDFSKNLLFTTASVLTLNNLLN